MVEIPSFPNPLVRSSWVQTELKKKGSSYSAIATDQGVHRSAVSNTMHMPNDRLEKAIAAELGVTQEALFSERFDAEGQRFHAVKHKAVKPPRNVKTSRAA